MDAVRGSLRAGVPGTAGGGAQPGVFAAGAGAGYLVLSTRAPVVVWLPFARKFFHAVAAPGRPVTARGMGPPDKVAPGRRQTHGPILADGHKAAMHLKS